MLVTAAGEIDIAVAADIAVATPIAGTAAEVPAHGRTPVLLDASAVTFLDAGGLRRILQTAHAVSPGSPLRIRNASAPVRRLIHVAELSCLLESHPAVER